MSASPNFPQLPSDWSEETGFLPKFSTQIFFRFFKRADAVKTGRALFVIHGLGEQSDRFSHFPHYLHSSFDAIGLIDLPGHGRSAGLRGHIENFDVFSEAAVAGFKYFNSRMNEQFGHMECHWLGTSMGGLISARTMFKFPNLPLTSVCLAEPEFGIAVKVPWAKEFFATLLEPVIGKVPLKSEIDANLLSHDPSVGAAYVSNSLNHSFVSPRLYVNMKREMASMATITTEFPYNLFLIVPLADQIVSWQDAYYFFDHVMMKTGTLKAMTSFPNWYHEVFNELEKGRAFTAYEDWIKKISKKA